MLEWFESEFIEGPDAGERQYWMTGIGWIKA